MQVISRGVMGQGRWGRHPPLLSIGNDQYIIDDVPYQLWPNTFTWTWDESSHVKSLSVESLGEADRPRWHHPRGWHPNKINLRTPDKRRGKMGVVMRRQLNRSSLSAGRSWLKKSRFFQEKIGWYHQLPPRVTPIVTSLFPILWSSFELKWTKIA